MNKKINLKSKKTQFIIIATLFVILLLIISIMSIRKRIYDAKIDLLIAPSSTTIKIDGKDYKNGKHDISSGKHTIELSKDGFQSQQEEIEIKSGETFIYYNYLLGLDSFTNWYETHEDDSLLLESIIPALSEKNLKSLQNKYPLIKQLPINEEYYSKNYSILTKYSISYKIDSENQIVIIVTYHTDNSKTAALEKITSLGFNTDDYQIEYINSTSKNWSKAE